jgi:aspartyl-tRNA(Asn)/glutamyl-tRNA(Gln) amidotransferase subunit C
MIKRSDVEYIAGLARLAISEEEKDAFARQLGTILEHVSELDGVDTTSVEPTVFMAPGHQPLRDDIVTPSLPLDAILANGPKVTKSHFAVPKVIG